MLAYLMYIKWFDTQAYNDKGTGNYKEAKVFGNIAICLTLINITYTLVADILIIGLTIPLHCKFLHILSTELLSQLSLILLTNRSTTWMLKDSTWNYYNTQVF